MERKDCAVKLRHGVPALEAQRRNGASPTMPTVHVSEASCPGPTRLNVRFPPMIVVFEAFPAGQLPFVAPEGGPRIDWSPPPAARCYSASLRRTSAVCQFWSHLDTSGNPHTLARTKTGQDETSGSTCARPFSDFRGCLSWPRPRKWNFLSAAWTDGALRLPSIMWPCRDRQRTGPMNNPSLCHRLATTSSDVPNGSPGATSGPSGQNSRATGPKEL